MSEHIIIVDDDQAFARVVEHRVKLGLQKARFTKFNNLKDFDNFLNAEHEDFDLLIIDEHLPDGRGSEFIASKNLLKQPVLSISSDLSDDMPARSLKAGAHYFLPKSKVSEALFQPLVLAVIERHRIEAQLQVMQVKTQLAEHVKTLVLTLKHEINNPLGTLMGACFVMKKSAKDPADQHTAEMIEQSAKRIQHVLEQFSQAIELEVVSKADHKVFQVPGDKKWES